MQTINVYFSREEALGEMRVREIVEHLVSLEGWWEALLKHWDDSPVAALSNLDSDLRDLIAARQASGPVGEAGRPTVLTLPVAAHGETRGITNEFYAGAVSIVNAEALTQNAVEGSSIAGLYVNKATLAGAGRGNREAGNFVLGHAAPTEGEHADHFDYHTGVWGMAYVTSGDGGRDGATRGNFYGFGGGVFVTPSAGLYLQAVIGAEFDVSVVPGVGVEEKIVLQLVGVNADAVKGSLVDAALLICADSTSFTEFDFGIAFGKPGSKWASTGTPIGTYNCSNALTAVKGIDLSAVSFSDSAFRSAGFAVGPDGGIHGSSTNVQISNLIERPEPSAPPAGQFYIYLDEADQKLKAKGPSGTVTVLANA